MQLKSAQETRKVRCIGDHRSREGLAPGADIAMMRDKKLLSTSLPGDFHTSETDQNLLRDIGVI